MHLESIQPGKVWLDTEGKRIHAHGGSIITVDDTFYWYGENKEKTRADNNIWHWGIRCYASKDLYNWEDKGLIIPPNETDTDSPLHPTQFVDRPHIVYNEKTKKYVCWLKVMKQDDGTQQSTVLTSSNILGPYEIVNTGLRPLSMSAGDFDLVVAPDGKGYYYFERVHNEFICADLTEDYTDVTGYYSTHFPNVHPPLVREAAAYFEREGKHYLITSGTTGYHPNPSEVAVGKTYHGPFEILDNPHVNDSSKTSFNSQISSVFKHPHKKDLYIALADRWLPKLDEKFGEDFRSGKRYEEVAENFKLRFGPGNTIHTIESDIDPYGLALDEDTCYSDYVWLPLRFEGENVYIDWQDEWKIEDYK